MILSISERISGTGPVPNIQHGWSHRVRPWAQEKSQSIHDRFSRMADTISMYWYIRTNNFSSESDGLTYKSPPFTILSPHPLAPDLLFRKNNLYRLFINRGVVAVRDVSTLSLKQKWARLCLLEKCMTIIYTALCIAPLAVGIFFGFPLHGIIGTLVTTTFLIFVDFISNIVTLDLANIVFNLDLKKISRKMQAYEILQKMRPTETTHQPESAPLVSMLDTRKIIHEYLTTSDLSRLSASNKATYLDFRKTALIPVKRVDSESQKHEKYVKMSRVLECVSMAECNIFEKFSLNVRRAYGDENLFKITRTPDVYPLIISDQEEIRRRLPTCCHLRYPTSLLIDSDPVLVQEQRIFITDPTMSVNLTEYFINMSFFKPVCFNLLRSPQLTGEENPPFFPSDTPLHAFLSGRVCQLRLKNPISIRYDSEAGRMRRLVSIPIAIGRKTEAEMREYVSITQTETEILIDTNPTKNLPVLSEAD